VKLGLVSDTHGYLDPRLATIFEGVEHILHAGDIGPDYLIAELDAVAPVTAVLGNNDNSPNFPLTKVVTIGAVKFLVHHIVSPRSLSDDLKERIANDKPDVVVFGHSHQKFIERINGIWFVNPGYAGKPKFGAERSVALLQGNGKKLEVRFVKLSDPA